MHKKISESTLVVSDRIKVKCTASIGVAAMLHGDNEASLFDRADGFLYKAKKEGKNRVICQN